MKQNIFVTGLTDRSFWSRFQIEAIMLLSPEICNKGFALPSASQRVTRSIALPVFPGFSGTKNLFSPAKLLSDMTYVIYDSKF